VLVIEPDDAGTLMVPERRRLLETCAALIAIALERVQPDRRATHARRHGIRAAPQLGAVRAVARPAHPVDRARRTVGNAGAGARRGDPGAESKALAIRDQAQRTARLVDNLLEMARLEGGRVDLRKDWQSLEELVGSALAALEPALAGHPVDVVLPPDLPLVRCDGVLIERVIVNLLENATKYTPPGTPIRVAAQAADGVLRSRSKTAAWSAARRERSSDSSRGNPESVVPGVGWPCHLPRHCRSPSQDPRGESRWRRRALRFTLPADEPPLAPLNLNRNSEMSVDNTPQVLVVEDDREIRRFVRAALEARDIASPNRRLSRAA
jgi:two-component system sensor histidine kinase KdpD